MGTEVGRKHVQFDRGGDADQDRRERKNEGFSTRTKERGPDRKRGERHPPRVKEKKTSLGPFLPGRWGKKLQPAARRKRGGKKEVFSWGGKREVFI